MRKKFLIGLCILILIIPIVISVMSFISVNNSPLTSNGISQVTIVDTAGADHKYERNGSALDLENIENNMVAYFVAMNESAETEISLPAPLTDAEYFDVTFVNYSKELSYKYYFSVNTDACYFVDNNGNCSRIGADYARAFLLSPCARCMYPGAQTPTLTLGSGDVVPYDTMTWPYGAYDATMIGSAELTGDDDSEKVYNLTDKIDLGFDVEPGTVEIKIEDGDTVLYEGLYENVSVKTFDKGVTFKITLTAKWSSNGGVAQYVFSGKIVEKPTFYTSSTTCEPGQFIVLRGIDVNDPSTISFTSEPSIQYTPTFYEVDGSQYAIIPISFSLEYNPSYKFTVKADGFEQTINISVTAKSFGTASNTASAENAAAKYTDETISSFNSNMSQIYSSGEAAIYFSGSFIDPVESQTVLIGYGKTISVFNVSKTYVNRGVNFMADSGDSVLAVNSGKVVYVGEQTLSGKIVVIEHGLGLRSSYWNMGSVSVSVGDKVTTGQTIGTVGFTGFCDEESMYCELSVFNIPVSIYQLWDGGVTIPRAE